MSYSKEKNPIFHFILSAISLLIHFNCLLDNPALDNTLLLTSLLSSSGNSADNNSSNTDETEANLIPIDLSLWTKRIKLTIDNSSQTEDLIDFPILVSIDSSFNYANTNLDGSDIRFSESTGTFRLDFEIDTWAHGGLSYFWVKVPRIPANSSTSFIWMYYGNPSATALDLGKSAWDSNYKAVYHLLDFSDSTNNNNTLSACDGLTNGSFGSIETAPSINNFLFGISRSFNGSTNCLRLPSNILSEGTIRGTIEMTILPFYGFLSSGDVWNLFSHSSTPESFSNNRLKMSIYNTSAIGCLPLSNSRLYVGLGNSFTDSCAGDSTFDIPVFSLNHLALSWNNGSYTVFRNNLKYTSTYNQTGLLANGLNEEIGLGARFNEPLKGYYSGIIDEVRLSDIPRSMQWINAQYLSKNNTYISLGIEENVP
ncbi:MAG: DUF2341 domain-containing protein [Leptospira sp.]|nr:DUF2341 domain-containing protein [Leptospira sp.]